MSHPSSIGVRDYYRRITSIDIGGIARELLNARITQSSERTLLCDCPNHHSQSKRSLNIMLDKQGWYCFGCGTGGDVLQLVEFVHAGCITRGQSGRMPESHREARDFLAARVGIPSLSHAGLSPEAIEEMERERLTSLRVFEALTALADYYHRRFLGNADALNWFRKKYRIGDEMIAGLKIGYAENAPWTDSVGSRQSGVLAELCKGPNAFTQAELSGTSACRPSGSSISPFFNRRIVFPYWSRGHVVFMIGRKTPWTPDTDWETPKYKKLAVRNGEKHAHVAACIRNDVLYNEDLLATRPNRVVITEGVTDCISLMEHGFPVVSPVTVQIKDADWDRILPKLAGAKTIYLCQDNELSEAGLQGALRTAQILIEKGITTRVATLPLGEKQQDARKQLKDRFGLHGPANSPKRVELEGRNDEESQLVAALLEQAKLDVNQYFAEGGTAADFEGLLTSAQTPLELSISRLSAVTPESEIDHVLGPILAAAKRLSPVEQERHLRLIQNRLGKERISLSVLRKQTGAIPVEQATKGKGRTFSGPSPQVQVENAASLPRIQVNNRQLRDVVSESWAAVHRANQPGAAIFRNTPYVFRRGEHLVYLAERAPTTEIEQMSEAAVFGLLARVADWYRATDENSVDAIPMKEAARDMLAFIDPSLPQLDAVIRTPVFGCDGSLIVTSGYHPKDRVWVDADSTLQLGRLSSTPTPEEIRAARDLFCDELFVNFPFKDLADRAHAVAAVILPFVRRMVEGFTPLHLIEAPSVGSGKGLLANIVAIVTTGMSCESRTLPEDEDEIRKMITAELLRARQIVLLDNADDRKKLHSPSLASVLTTDRWTDRLLGVSAMASVPNQALWMMTANNPNLDLELTRRCIRVRIDPRLDRPWMRTEFRHPDLHRWVKANRGPLVHAALTLVLAWIANGRHMNQKRLGNFEGWSELVGGILEVAGIDGFLANLDQLYDQADQDGHKFREFTAAWWETFKDAEKQVKELNEFCEQHELMLEIRGDGTPRSQQVRLGITLSRCRDRLFGNLRVVKIEEDSKHKGGNYYRLAAGQSQ
jgi:DNA primase